jgi:virulence-associated protein VagC
MLRFGNCYGTLQYQSVIVAQTSGNGEAVARPCMIKSNKIYREKIPMHTFKTHYHINENGILSVKLPKEWAEKDVNVLLVLEFLNQLKEPAPEKQSLAAAFDLLAEMPENFMDQRQDEPPQERSEWL